MPLLDASGVSVFVGRHEAVRNISFQLERGTRLGVVGESGAGKTLTALATIGLLPEGTRATGAMSLDGQNLLQLSEPELCRVRGGIIGMIFQDPLSSLNPMMRIDRQIMEGARRHLGMGIAAARRRAIELLSAVQIADPEEASRKYPHQLSGGQRQRVMIAVAMASKPALLIADEPTTALDASARKGVLDVIKNLCETTGTSLMLITHDLSVVAYTCPYVMVMYGGLIVERGATHDVFSRPRHPYTSGLLDSMPRPLTTIPAARRRRFRVIPGSVPSLGAFPSGCPFRDRCNSANYRCAERPDLLGEHQEVRCWHPLDEHSRALRVKR